MSLHYTGLWEFYIFIYNYSEVVLFLGMWKQLISDLIEDEKDGISLFCARENVCGTHCQVPLSWFKPNLPLFYQPVFTINLPICLLTGFMTAKGGLLRSIMFPKKVDFKFYRDTYYFILALAAIAFLGMIYTVAIMVCL